MGFERIQGQRVALRDHNGVEDTATIKPWLDEVVAAAGTYEPDPPPPGFQRAAIVKEGLPLGGRSGSLVIERVAESGPVGFMEYQAAGGWLTVAFIGLAKAYRGWGYGSEAVRLLEEWTVREGIGERFRAGVPLRNGLGLYFWLRLGYRPAEPSGGRDTMEMVRET